LTHQGGHWNFDPILTRAFMIRAVASCMSLALTPWPCDALPRPQFGFAEASSAYISRIAQHCPHRRSFPPGDSFARRDLALVEHSRDRIDAARLFNVGLKYKAHHFCFGFHHFVVSRRRVALLHVSIAVRRSGQHTDRALLGAMPLPSPRALQYLRALVFGDHALELHQQLILRSGNRRTLYKP
jgi:hypothetical protein